VVIALQNIVVGMKSIVRNAEFMIHLVIVDFGMVKAVGLDHAGKK